MQKARFTEEQLATMLREADKTPLAQVARQCGIGERTGYAWRKRYGKLQAADVKEIRALRQDNARLKKLRAERDLATQSSNTSKMHSLRGPHPRL